MNNNVLSIPWLKRRSCNSVDKTLGVDFIVTSHIRSIFNSADINIQDYDLLIAIPALKSNAGNKKVCKKKYLSWLFGADRKNCPSGSLFGITRQSLVLPNNDPQMSVCLSWKNELNQTAHKPNSEHLRMSHDMTKPTKWVCAQRILRSAWASAQSDQSLRCALNW